MGVFEDVGNRLSHAWNAFKYNEDHRYVTSGPVTSYRPDREYIYSYGSQTIISSIYTRIAIDIASLSFIHARLSEDGRIYEETIESGLNECLSVEANIDQSYFDFMMDVAMSLLDEGVIAIVPTETDLNPNVTGSYNIKSMRTGKILEWYPDHVRVRLYNDRTGRKEELVLPKSKVAIIENPFYSIMNEPNSTAQRLIRKLALLDNIDEEIGSGKLNMIIQLPYVVKTEARRQQAENRRNDIERQLTESKFGIAYTDGTEKIIQIGRAHV